MICWNCGNAIDDKAYVCVHCGAAMYAQKPAVDPNEPANGGFIALSLLVPIFGIIYGAVESGNGKKRAGKTYLTCGISAIIAWTVIPIILTVIGALVSIVLSLLPLLLIGLQNS